MQGDDGAVVERVRAAPAGAVDAERGAGGQCVLPGLLREQVREGGMALERQDAAVAERRQVAREDRRCGDLEIVAEGGRVGGDQDEQVRQRRGQVGGGGAHGVERRAGALLLAFPDVRHDHRRVRKKNRGDDASHGSHLPTNEGPTADSTLRFHYTPPLR